MYLPPTIYRLLFDSIAFSAKHQKDYFKDKKCNAKQIQKHYNSITTETDPWLLRNAWACFCQDFTYALQDIDEEMQCYKRDLKYVNNVFKDSLIQWRIGKVKLSVWTAIQYEKAYVELYSILADRISQWITDLADQYGFLIRIFAMTEQECLKEIKGLQDFYISNVPNEKKLHKYGEYTLKAKHLYNEGFNQLIQHLQYMPGGSKMLKAKIQFQGNK